MKGKVGAYKKPDERICMSQDDKKKTTVNDLFTKTQPIVPDNLFYLFFGLLKHIYLFIY